MADPGSRTSAAGYIYVEMFITDPEAVRHYAAVSGKLVEVAGGQYIALGTPVMLEGTRSPSRCALIRFDSAAAAESFYHCEAYRDARDRRKDAGEFRIVPMS